MILGIDLGGTNLRIGRIEEGTVRKKVSVPGPAALSLNDSLNYLKDEIAKMLTSDAEGIGIGVPSVVDASKGIVYNATNIPSWEEVHLKDILQCEFNLPVFVNNDCNCFILGEKEYGQGKSYKDIVGVTLGTGVGAGLIIDNKLYNGRNTGAGEICSLPYLDATLEQYCSSEFFLKHYRITGEEAARKAYAGDPAAFKIWEEFGRHIGNLMQTILYAYDPELIILGGGISGAYSLFESQMRNTLMQFPYPETIKNIEIKISDNKDASLFGAAALVSSNMSVN